MVEVAGIMLYLKTGKQIQNIRQGHCHKKEKGQEKYENQKPWNQKPDQ